MANSFKIPLLEEMKLRKRDKNKCVYCGKNMKTYDEIKTTTRQYNDQASIEHLYYKKPFYWYDENGNRTSLTLESLAICCRGCNSSRRDKPLTKWFGTKYCLDRKNPISESSVSDSVRKFINTRKNLGGTF